MATVFYPRFLDGPPLLSRGSAFSCGMYLRGNLIQVPVHGTSGRYFCSGPFVCWPATWQRRGQLLVKDSSWKGQVAELRRTKCFGASRADAGSPLHDEDKIRNAKEAAHLRADETKRPDALVIDPLAAALSDGIERCSAGACEPYLVATRWIDERLMEVVSDLEQECRQVVLLSDGMDTRPYRLPWLPQTVIFDVSPAEVYTPSQKILKEKGAKVPRGCLLCHVSADLSKGEDWRDEGWGEKLIRVGYRGDRPSVWAIQGLEGLTADGLQSVLGHVSCLARKGSWLIGQLPVSACGASSLSACGASSLSACGASSLSEAEEGLGASLSRNRFLARVESWESVGTSLGRPFPEEDRGVFRSILFLAQQQRLSDAQVEAAMVEMATAEDGWGEDGFEDLY